MDHLVSKKKTMDRLSELPDSLIILILSLLPMPDVVRTMILSKRWLHLWETVPCLDFGDRFHRMFNGRFQQYIDFISSALPRWKGSEIHKFSFGFYGDDTAADSWLLFAIEKQVEELHVRNHISIFEYCGPQRLYSCSSIAKMSLSQCALRIGEAVQWNGLKSLTLHRSNGLTEDAMNRILAGAPVLEELKLYCFELQENLNIRSTSLKILVFDYDDSLCEKVEVRIWAPNLLDLQIYGCFCGTIFSLDAPSLTKADICFQESPYSEGDHLSFLPLGIFDQLFQSIGHVEKLTLSDFTIKILLSYKHNLKFPNAKSLSYSVGGAKEMLGVLHMFPNLTTLCVQQDEYQFDALVEELEEDDSGEEDDFGEVDLIGSHLSKADLPSPSLLNLKMVNISWFMRDVSIIPSLEILLENAMLLEKMVLRANWKYWVGDKSKLLLSKSASSSTAELIIIHEG